MTQSLRFVLCADDYGISPAVSRGILEAVATGALSATSVMTTSPYLAPWRAPLLAHRGRIDIGLHLNLTMGAPLGPCPILAPDGHLPSVRALIGEARHHRLPEAELSREIDRQLDAFQEGFGGPPDHVDGHQHVHALPQVRDLLFASLSKRGWRPWLRDSADKVWRLPFRAEPMKALIVAIVTEGFATAARQAGFVCNDSFAGFSAFDPTRDYARLFRTYLRRPGRRHLVMCHPGHVDAELRAQDPVVETREQELSFLLTGLTATLGGGFGLSRFADV